MIQNLLRHSNSKLISQCDPLLKVFSLCSRLVKSPIADFWVFFGSHVKILLSPEMPTGPKEVWKWPGGQKALRQRVSLQDSLYSEGPSARCPKKNISLPPFQSETIWALAPPTLPSAQEANSYKTTLWNNRKYLFQDYWSLQVNNVIFQTLPTNRVE